MDDHDDMGDLDRSKRPAYKFIVLVVVLALLPLFAIYVLWQVFT
jgi:hypothetical protein